MTTSAFLTLTPWRDIWVRPRATLRAVAAGGPNHVALVFPIAWGILQSLLQGAQNNVGLRASLSAILLMATVIGALWGLLQVHLLAGLIHLVGRWIGARASYYAIRSVFSWGTLPVAVSLTLWLAGAAIFGRALFVADQAVVGGGPAIVLATLILYLTTAALWLWSAILVVLGTAEVHGVSVWKAIGMVIASALLIGVGAILILWLFIIVS